MNVTDGVIEDDMVGVIIVGDVVLKRDGDSASCLSDGAAVVGKTVVDVIVEMLRKTQWAISWEQMWVLWTAVQSLKLLSVVEKVQIRAVKGSGSRLWSPHVKFCRRGSRSLRHGF